ncbi:Hypothetical predicted protein [Paramuricea clavata]|uniref:Uncharacterized protein n=1 Tax=Paramuricea clavata TaxID=317549 RepID=A0A7D9LXN6_PARCT|nr:Hypothetical predicted protein [Paramuricea clavata]
MKDGRIKDSQITVTSFIRTAHSKQARLRQNMPNWGAWCPNMTGMSMLEGNYDQYIQIDLLNLTKITRIATQGREYNEGREWAKVYKLSYRKNGATWHYYKEKDEDAKLFSPTQCQLGKQPWTVKCNTKTHLIMV